MNGGEKKVTLKQKKQRQAWLRAGIQLIFFIMFPSAYTAAFQGVKYIFTQIGQTKVIEMTNFVYILIGLCMYTILFGRYFCGYACAFGSFGDAVNGLYKALCKKVKKKPMVLPVKIRRMLSGMKYAVLVLIVLLCFSGDFHRTKGMSPWDVFSLVRSGNFSFHGYTVGVIILLLIMAGMCVQERFFCRFLCPMGAVFSLLPVLPLFSLRRDRSSCIKGCRACTLTCPADIELPDQGSISVVGDCFQCQKCTAGCPKSNISTGISAIKGNEIWFIVIRSILLAALFVLLGV